MHPPVVAESGARLSTAAVTELVARTLVEPAPADRVGSAGRRGLDQAAADRVAETLLRLTHGAPGLVELALGDGPAPWAPAADPLAWLCRPGGPVTRWVEADLLPRVTPSDRLLLELARDLDPLPRHLAAAVGDIPDLTDAWDALHDQWLIGEPPASASAGAGAAPAAPRLVPLLAGCLARRSTAPRGARAWWSRAADDYLDRGLPGPALRAVRHAGDADRCRRIVEEYGDQVVTSGWAEELITTVDSLSPAERSVRVRTLHGHAARISGRAHLAEQLLESVLGDIRSWGETPPADLVWRLAAVKHGAADFRAARELCTGARFPLPEQETPRDRGLRLATLALAQWMLGDDEAAAGAAAEALAAARDGDDDALGTAQLAQSLLLTGARRHNTLAGALAAAERSGNVYLEQRTLVNLADAHLVAGEYAAARDAALRAVALVDRTGAAGCYVAARHNLGEALLALGDLPRARLQFLRCLDVARGQGLDRTPAALYGLAEVDYRAGQLGDARAALEEALELARETGERQVMVAALARLATVVATEPRDDDDLKLAGCLAEEAAMLAGDEVQAEAAVALGWVRLAQDDLAAAADLAEEAATLARTAQNRRALGPALELAAEAQPDARDCGALLLEALATHERSGDVLSADRVRLALARLPGSFGPRGTAARGAVRRLRRLGALVKQLHPQGPAGRGSIEIRVLGGFAVTRDDVPVPASAWRSRQARTLLKLLVARQGRPIGREELCDLLWPDDDPAKTGHRLSVLLSTLRGVLDPDKDHPLEHFVSADAQGIRLALGNATLDLLDFLDDAAEAARLADDGDEDAARQLLADLLAGYSGEAFEEDPYESWADDVRHHVRATWTHSLRLAARLAGRAGDIDAAVTCLVRLLATDVYDEPAHRMLVAVLVRAGRHGEARRAFERWSRAMAEVGAPGPDESLLEPQSASL